MNNICFVFHSKHIQLYMYNCITAVQELFENSQIYVFIDETKKSESISFNKIIQFVDDRFSNYKENPFNSVNLDKLKNIEFITNFNISKTFDWIVLENEYCVFNNENFLTKNGFLTLCLDIEFIKKQVLYSDQICLNILYKKTIVNSWLAFSQSMKCENGIQNNVYKCAFNYSIYLIKLLKNYSFEICLSDYKPSDFKEVGSFSIFKYYLKLVNKLIKRKLSKEKFNWKIAILYRNKSFFLNQPANSYWADPFIVKKNATTAIFFEELQNNKKGVISCVTLNECFEILEKKIILEKEYHLSFPYIFEQNDKVFMIPESSASNSLKIYECINFPFEWQFHSTLIDGIKLIDVVFVFHENRYWLFANKVHTFEHDNNEKLFLYYSDDLFSGTWQPHIQNPIVTNAASSRNAGKIYSKNNKLYRVSQNCFDAYGGNIVLNEITILTTANYSESITEEIFAQMNYHGIHTMNFQDDLTIVDYLYKEK